MIDCGMICNCLKGHARALAAMACVFGMVLLGGCGDGGSGHALADALRMARRGDWADALPIAEKRVREVPTDSDAVAFLALCLFHNGEGADSRNRAMNLMRQAADALPERYDIQYAYGVMLFEAKSYTDAMQPLKRAYELHLKEEHSIPQETQGDVKYALGMCCLRNNKFADAAKYLEQAARSNPYAFWPDVQNDIAVSLFFQGKYLEAMNALDAAMKLNAANARLAEKKKAELESLQQKGTPAQVKNKQNEIAQISYAFPHVTGLNMAVACDYLSYKQYNPRNPEAFRSGAVSWYGYALGAFQKARREAGSASQQIAYGKTISSIELRRAALSR